MMYDTDEIPVKKDWWYIVWLRDFRFITLYPVYFINKESAKRAIRVSFPPTKRSRYSIIAGDKLREYTLKYTIKLGKMPKFTKYDFPKDFTKQQKKTRRTIIRRRLRRMGMLIPKKHKIGIKDKVKQARLLVNKQKVADCPTTEAVAFRLERKPKHFYYIILKKKKSQKNKIAFRVKAIRYNSRNGEYKKLFINIYNRDVLIPHLISEVFSQADKNNQYEEFKRYCLKRGIKVYKTKKKKVLQGNLEEMG